MFFKNNKEIKTEDLKLSNYDQIWTKFCFMDETGSLNYKTDPYFTIGMIKMSQPYYLQSKILYERNKKHFYDEMKFNKLSKKNIGFAKFLIESFLDTRSISFYSYTTDKNSPYFNKNFGGNHWKAYQNITLKLLDATLSEKEILILVADHITTPKTVRFEVDVKKKFNSYKKRLALAGVCRFDSRTNDLLQVIDLIIGAITYDLKFKNKLVSGDKHKLGLLNFLKENLGIKSFEEGFRNRNFNIFVENEKRQSS